MICFNVGFKFEEKFLRGIIEINKTYKNKMFGDYGQITSVYGSMSNDFLPTARPDFRLKKITIDSLMYFVTELGKHNIRFKYAFNSPFLGKTNKYIYDFLESKKKNIKKLIDMGINDFVISNPLFVEFMLKNFPTANIEISTIMHVDNLNHIVFLKNRYKNINGLVLDLYRNKDIGFVEAMQDVCLKNNILLEVMCSEACLLGLGTPCKGIYRQFCYDRHTSVDSLKDSEMFNMFPQGRCILARHDIDAATFLTNRMIFPNDIRTYSRLTGVKNFKITVRTAPVDFALSVINAYVSMSYGRNLFSLWQHIEGNRAQDEKADKVQDAIESRLFIDGHELFRFGFMQKWYSNLNFKCSDFLCVKKEGISNDYECNYCYRISTRLKKKK
jgi:collagenase-like PrtC family protease